MIRPSGDQGRRHHQGRLSTRRSISFEKPRPRERQWLAELEAREREKTGIKNLRIKYNKVFGYYLEVTNSYKDMVPDYYMRKQTLTNAERYITPELKELEDMILGAEDKLFSLEYDLFCRGAGDRLPEKCCGFRRRPGPWHRSTCLPPWPLWRREITMCGRRSTRRGIIDIKNGRHPVVEKMMQQRHVHCQRYLSGQWKSPDFHHHRPEHGRKIHLHAADGPDCAHGPDGQLCAGR